MTETGPAAHAQAAPAPKLTPLTPAERMRRSRERRKMGLFCLTLELRMSEVDALVRCSRLKPEERTSPPAIKNAVYSVLENFVLSTTPFRATTKPGNRAPGAPA